MKTLLEIIDVSNEPNILQTVKLHVMNEIQIEFESKEALEMFVKWFNKQGFDQFTQSKFNKPVEGGVTCMATDEKMDWGHFYQLQ